jgi:sigma-E factor negative regulatory protein RseB
MRRWRIEWVAVLMIVSVGLLSTATALAQTVSSEQLVKNPADAKALLEGIQSAAKRLNYQGVFSQQRDGVVHAFRMTHRFDGQREEELLEVLDNSPREYWRIDDEVQCLMPEQKLVVTESQRQERFPALLMSELSGFSRYYEVSVDPALGRVAGRHCLMIDIEPKDEYRPRYRLCADEDTGLLLKAQLLDRQGNVLEQIAFGQVQIGHTISDEALARSWSTEGWQRIDRKPVPIDFQAMGWDYTVPPGFSPVMQIRRQFSDGREVSQMILTDGLASVSIFIEPYQKNLSQHQWQGASQAGSINLYGNKVEDSWVVVVGEAPALTIHQLAQSIDRRRAPPTQ